MNWTWFHKLGSPKWFYEISGRWLPWFAVAAALLIVTGCVWGLAFAPPDYQQGNSFRIIYIHVPAAFLAHVHDVDLTTLDASPRLAAAIEALPGEMRRLGIERLSDIIGIA